MAQEDKELLLKDLFGRLPYGIKCKDPYGEYIDINIYNAHLEHLVDQISSGEIKMVLRPMSSMTEEEFQEIHSICPHSAFNKTNVPGWIIGIDGSDYGRISRVDEISKLLDWLNKKMFDYRKDDEGKTMIEKGLALEAPKDMYRI